MRILITACNGQLGTDAVTYFSKENEVVAYKDIELDITDELMVTAAVRDSKPDLIINTAAITNVDGCEANEELAHNVNAHGAGVVAKAAENTNAVLAHISTDYVFDGTKTTPYIETDETCPKNVYGRSKLEGENKVLENCSRSFIFRTAWLYGPHGNNFVKTMLKIGSVKGEVDVVTDQTGNPTSTFELLRIIDSAIKSKNYGIYHATCEGACSWNTFAREIFRVAKLNVKVNNITSEKMLRPAFRPAFSVLSKQKLFECFGYRPASWQQALQEYFEYLNGTVSF